MSLKINHEKYLEKSKSAECGLLCDYDGGETSKPRPRTWLLLLGIAVTALSGNRFNVPLLGWVASAPWLVYLRRTSDQGGGWRLRDAAAFLAAVQVGACLNMSKLVTDFIPWTFAPFMSVPAALAQGVWYLVFEALRRVLGDAWGLAVFPSLEVSIEWIWGVVLGQSSWGCLAYTQIDDLALLQVVSLLGLGGVSFLLASSSAVAAVILDAPDRASYLPAAVAVGMTATAAQAWGSWRLDRGLPPGPTVTVATVGTDLGMFLEGLPSRFELEQAEDVLFERTRSAAEAGAKLVVWNEMATIVPSPKDEATLLGRGEALSREHGVDIVMGYAVPLEGMRRYENKYVWVGPEGAVETYHKHRPVPGEGCVPGVEPLRILNRTWGQAAGGICYDYDFTDLAMAHARGGAGVVAVPASDWQGLDPYHTTYASVRGIEGGFSVVRSVRCSTSGAYDALGRTRATSSWHEDGRRIMLARVPVTPVPTLYSQIGDVLPWTCLVFVVAVIGVAATRWHRCGGSSQEKVSGSSAPSSLSGSKAAAKAKAA